MRNKRVATRVVSVMLSAALAFTTAFGLSGVTKASAADKEKIVVYVAAEGEDGVEADKVSVKKTAVMLDEDAVAEDAIKAALDSSEFKGNYVIKASDWGDSLDSIGKLAQYNVGSDWYYWGFYVNGQYASNGIGSQTLSDQDQISLIYNYNNTNMQASDYVDDAAKNPENGYAQYSENAKKAQEVLAQKIYETTFQNGKYVPGIEDSAGLYAVFSLARADFKADKFYDNVYAKIKAQLGAIKTSYGSFYDDKSKKEVSQETILKDGYASQTYAKIALCVTALGKDASNVNGFNVIEKLADKTVYNASSIYNKETTILLAIDSKDYELPVGENYLTRADLINFVTADIENQIQVSIDWKSIDSAAMTLQPLAAYRTKTVEGVDSAKVKKACDKAWKFIYNMQAEDGTYSVYGASNAWTTAQVMIAAGLFNIDVATEQDGTDLIKNGVTLYDDALSFVDAATGKVDDGLMGFQPDQLLRGINACVRASEKGEKLLPVESASYQASEDAVYTLPTKPTTPSTAVVKLGKAKISKLTAGKKQLTVTYAKVSNAKKYKVQVSTDKKFKKNVITKTTTAQKLTVKKLKTKKVYYVRVQAVSGKKTGAYSAVKKVKVK